MPAPEVRQVPTDEVSATFAQMAGRVSPRDAPGSPPPKKDRQPLDRIVDLEASVADLEAFGAALEAHAVPVSRVDRLEGIVTALSARVDAITSPATGAVAPKELAAAAGAGPHDVDQAVFYNGLLNLEAAGWKLQFTAPSA